MRRRRHRPHPEFRTRDHATIATPVRSVTKVRPGPAAVLRSFLSELEDRREFNPEGDQRRARTFKRRADAALVPALAPARAGSSFVPGGVGFSKPGGVVLCVRRTVRRRVMHAKGKAGSYYPGKWSEYSYIDCTDHGGHRFKRR